MSSKSLKVNVFEACTVLADNFEVTRSWYARERDHEDGRKYISIPSTFTVRNMLPIYQRQCSGRAIHNFIYEYLKDFETITSNVHSYPEKPHAYYR